MKIAKVYLRGALALLLTFTFTDEVWADSETKLLASDGTAADDFGGGVSISGDTALIAARQDTVNGPDSGSAYIFERDAGDPDNWGEVKKLVPSDGAAGDAFGISVSLSGDTAIVAAYLDDDNGSNSGSVYVFERNAGGPDNWGEVKKILVSDGGVGDEFGVSVSVSGDRILVGANFDDDNGSQSGAAYVFERQRRRPE